MLMIFVLPFVQRILVSTPNFLFYRVFYVVFMPLFQIFYGVRQIFFLHMCAEFSLYSLSPHRVLMIFAKRLSLCNLPLILPKWIRPWNRLEISLAALPRSLIPLHSLRAQNSWQTMLGRRATLNGRSLMLFSNNVAP